MSKLEEGSENSQVSKHVSSYRCSGKLFKLYVVYYLPSQSAVPWLRRLVAGLSPRRPAFASRSFHVGFVADIVALGPVFLQVLCFFPVNIIRPWLSMLMYHLGDEQ
jgi:hypothetical protein